MDDQNKKNQPTYLSNDSNPDVLTNIDVQTGIDTKKPTLEQEGEQFGYDSPYVGTPNTLQVQQPTPTQTVVQAQQPANIPSEGQFTNPNIPPVQTNAPAAIQEADTKPKVVYEKTIVEKEPSFLSNVFSELFRCSGCFLLLISVIIAVAAYILNF